MEELPCCDVTLHMYIIYSNAKLRIKYRSSFSTCLFVSSISISYENQSFLASYLISLKRDLRSLSSQVARSNCNDKVKLIANVAIFVCIIKRI